jgi:hypothetical protein
MHRFRTMSPAVRLFPVVLVLAACNRDETTSAPKAVEVEEAPVAASESSEVPKALVVSGSELTAPAVMAPWEGKVIVKGPAAKPPPRKRLAQVVEKVGEGLETTGQKTREAAAVAEERTGEAIDVARERTKTGFRKAADASGDFLQRAGEKIEGKAEEAGEP